MGPCQSSIIVSSIPPLLFISFLIIMLLLPGHGTLASFYLAPTFVLDLSKAPEDRWTGSVSKIIALHGWENSFGAVIDMYEPTEFASINATVKGSLQVFLQRNYPTQYRELVGLAREFSRVGHGEMNISRLATWVWFYEFGSLNFTTTTTTKRSDDDDNKKTPRHRRRHTACTGVLVLPRNKALPIIHGRNMDEDPRGGKNCSLDITVIDSNNSYTKSSNGTTKQLYRLYDWTWWFLAFWTAAKPGALTMQWNWRTHRFLPLDSILHRIFDPSRSLQKTIDEENGMIAVKQNTTITTMPTAFMFRHVMESSMDFDDAVRYFSGDGGAVAFASRFYIIMSGSRRRGAVISVSFNQSNTNISFMNDTIASSSSSTNQKALKKEYDRRWFMVQTNYDRWKPDPADDPRRTVAEHALLNVLGRKHGTTRMGVWATMSTFPVHNPTTMQTIIMSAGTGAGAEEEEHQDGDGDGDCLQGYIRTAMMPCAPGQCHY